jgi:hypothetical protein
VKYILALICLLAAPALAAYQAEEMCVIPWGDGENSLKMAPTVRDMDFDYPGICPTQGFVDKDENVYLNSIMGSYYKAFRADGTLIADFSARTLGTSNSFFENNINDFVVDNEGFYYFSSFPPLKYIPVSNSSGELVRRLFPFGESSDVLITSLFQVCDSIITVSCKDSGLYSYSNGIFIKGGSYCKLGKNNYYYGAYARQPDTLVIVKGNQPEQNDLTNYNEYNLVISDSIHSAEILNISSLNHLYILIRLRTSNALVSEYSDDLKLIDQIYLSNNDSICFSLINPYVRSDGNIYEFRCLDDGLHVIRWSKK